MGANLLGTRIRTLLSATAALFLVMPRLAAQSADSAPPLQWFTAPALFPRGANLALISGDPLRPGPFSALLSLPDGYKMPPHFHTTDEHVEVKQGSFLVGMGDKMDLKKTRAMTVGDTATAPAGMHHYAAAKGATIVSVTATGPYVMTYVHSEQEPWRPFPFNY
ncbi:MAG: cupin domain-containing protein [Gemmatimonadales bacterium]